MSIDKPLHKQPPFELSIWQKRQAALLYHFASLEYLEGLKPMVDDLIAWMDEVIEQRQPMDKVGVANHGWKPGDTVANWSTNAYPYLIDLQQSLAKDVAQRAIEVYSETGVYGCFRGMSYVSMLWATQEQEDEFKKREEVIYSYARRIDGILARPTTWDDFSAWYQWNEFKSKFPRLPRFRVRMDVEGETDKIPPRTGVYVPQDDPYGALQFRWAGGDYGELGDTYTFNELGLDALKAVGREGLWGDEQGLLDFAMRHKEALGEHYFIIDGKPESELAPSAVAREAFTNRPCKWYFVEKIEGEFEDAEEAERTSVTVGGPRRVPGGKPCPQSGWWFTPAKQDSRRYFKQGEELPSFEGSDYGETLWQWAPDQSDPKL